MQYHLTLKATISSDMNIEHISCVQLDFTAYFHLMPSLVKYSFPCHAINLRFLIKMFFHDGRKVNFSPRYHNWSSPYELYRCISSHCYSDHAWWFARSVHLFRYAPHKRTNIEKISPERSLEIHLFLVPMQSYENIKKIVLKKGKYM